MENVLYGKKFAIAGIGDHAIEVSGPGRPIRTTGVRCYFSVDAFPEGERVIAYLLKVRNREPNEVRDLLLRKLSPTMNSNVISDRRSHLVIIIERSSVIRSLLSAVHQR